MAEISNGLTGGGRLAVRLQVLRKEPPRGIIARGSVAMNSDLTLLWTRVSFWVGEKEIFGQEVLLHSSSILAWSRLVEESQYDQNTEFWFPVESPELGIMVRHFGTGEEAFVQMLVYIEVGIATGESGVWQAGPAMLMEVDVDKLHQFAGQLRSEAEMVMLWDRGIHWDPGAGRVM